MKKLFMYSLLGFLSFNAFKSEALTPFEAASLAQAAEKRNSDFVENFEFVAQEVARPNGDDLDQILAQLWVNHVEKEYVVVFNTTKAIGKWDLAAILNKVYPKDYVVAFAREQGRIYNNLVKQSGYPELAGGYVQQVGAMLVSGVTNTTYALGRGFSFAASSIGSLFTSSSQPAQQVEQEEIEHNNIKELPDGYLGKLVESAHNLYLDLLKHVENDEYTIKVVGHCFGGYYAQIIASFNDIDGYSFASFGMNLPQADKSKNFVNYRHVSDRLSELNEAHYGKTIALNDLPLNVIDNLDDHIRSLKIKDVASTRWAIMDDYLTKNHAIDGFVDQLNPSNKKSKSVQNSNAHIVDRSSAPISSPVAPKADPIIIHSRVAPTVSKPIAPVEVKNEAEEIIIAPSIVPVPSSEPAPFFAPPPPPPAMDDLIDNSVVAADGKPMSKAEQLKEAQRLKREKAAKINEAAAANKSALAARLAALRDRVEEVSVLKVSEEQEMKNAKTQQFMKEYESISNDSNALENALAAIAEEQEAYKDDLKDPEVKALFDENCLRRDALKALQGRLGAPKKK